MKTKFFCTLILLVLSVSTFCQTNNKFYKSIEDARANKFIDGYEIESKSWEMGFGKESFTVKSNSSSKKTKLKELPSEFYSYDGAILKTVDNKACIVLIEGKYSYYSEYGQQAVTYYTEPKNGEVLSFSEKAFKKLLKTYRLLDNYEADEPKREKKDSVNDWFNKKLSRTVKYFKLLNEEYAKNAG